MLLFKCKIPGRARSKKNSKQIMIARGGRRFIGSSKEFKAWAAFAAGFIVRARAQSGLQTIDYPCNLTVRGHYRNHQHNQDLDNLITSVCDVLQDCEIIKDDKFFYSYDGSKKIYESETDFVEIEIHSY